MNILLNLSYEHFNDHVNIHPINVMNILMTIDFMNNQLTLWTFMGLKTYEDTADTKNIL